MRWGRLVFAAGSVFAVLAVVLGLSRLGAWPGRPSPFEGLLPAETPLAVEGDAAAVLDLLRRTPPLGTQVIEDFRLSLRGSAGQRMLFALLPHTQGNAAAADRCRNAMAAAVTALENEWEGQQAYPSSGPGFACPAGGRASYAVDGEDFVLECRSDSHTVTYDSRTGFERQTARGPAVLVGLERSGDEGGTQLLCSQPELLDQLLAGQGPRLELPGPSDAPLRAVGGVEPMEALIHGPWPAMAPGGRVQLWGDPAEERWSLRLPLPAPDAAPGGEVAEALRELPPSPVALAAVPGFLRLLAPTLAEELALGGAEGPRCVAVAMEEPFTRDAWREELARRLAGRGGTVVAATFPDENRLTQWVQRTPWAGVLAGSAPGAELETRGAAAVLRLGGWQGGSPSRPTLPSGGGEAALAGWVTVAGPKGRRAIYCVAAGTDKGGTWLELCREDAPPVPEPVAQDETPVIQSR